jgi:hypothetical protein
MLQVSLCNIPLFFFMYWDVNELIIPHKSITENDYNLIQKNLIEKGIFTTALFTLTTNNCHRIMVKRNYNQKTSCLAATNKTKNKIKFDTCLLLNPASNFQILQVIFKSCK